MLIPVWASASFENRTYQEVLASLYSGCELKKENVFLNEDQHHALKKQIDLSISKLVLRYKNSCNNSYVYIDSHIVRTLNETIVLELNQDKVKLIEVASFMEPKEYLPPHKWLKQFIQSDDVDGLTGATLTQNAIKSTVKKYKILNRLINESAGKETLSNN